MTAFTSHRAAWPALFFAIVLVLQVVYSKYGRAMKAVRDDEDAAIAVAIIIAAGLLVAMAGAVYSTQALLSA